MNIRYEQIFRSQNSISYVGCPVTVEAFALVKDNNDSSIMAQVKLRRCSEEEICAVVIKYVFYDAFDNKLGETEHEFLDLTISNDEPFCHKETVLLPDARSRKLEVELDKILMGNGSIWRRTDELTVIMDYTFSVVADKEDDQFVIMGQSEECHLDDVDNVLQSDHFTIESENDSSEIKTESDKKDFNKIWLKILVPIIVVIVLIIFGKHLSVVSAKKALADEYESNSRRIAELKEREEKYEECREAYTSFEKAYQSLDPDDEYSVEMVYEKAVKAEDVLDVYCSSLYLSKLTGDYDDVEREFKEAYKKILEKRIDDENEKISLLERNLMLELQLKAIW